MQLTTDGHSAYLKAVPDTFGKEIDWGMLVKQYGGVGDRYQGSETMVLTGGPDLDKISTSYVERSNLTIRMGNRRYTRRTNAHGKRLDHHLAMLGLFMFHYNLIRPHRSLKTTPAVEAGVADRIWTIEEMLEFVEDCLPRPTRPKRYQKRRPS